jgi:hypothetical protein
MADTNIILTEIVCISTSEPGNDEVYINYSIDGGREQRFPSSGYVPLSPDSPPWLPNLPLSFKQSAVVSLKDNDKGGDDFLGSHTYLPSEPQPETVQLSHENGARYSLSSK